MANNERGEDWPAHLKAMQDPYIQAILSDDPSARLNRQQRRNSKRPAEIERAIKAEEAKDKERNDKSKFRSLKMGQWFSETYKQLLPLWMWKKVNSGDNFWIGFLGYAHQIDHANDMLEDKDSPLGHKLIPTSICSIFRKRFYFFGSYKVLKIKMTDKEGVDRKVDSVFKFIWG